MAHPAGYRLLLPLEVSRYYLDLRLGERRKLDKLFDFLVENPHASGDYQEHDQDGRTLEIVRQGRFLLTFWSDHAVKEVRVVRVEKTWAI